MVNKICGCKESPSPWELEDGSTVEQSSSVQSSTPRTDALLRDPHLRSNNQICTLARQIETELTAALRERDEANVLLEKALDALKLCNADAMHILGIKWGHDGDCGAKTMAEEIADQSLETLKEITNHLSK